MTAPRRSPSRRPTRSAAARWRRPTTPADPAGRDGRHPRQRPDPDSEPGDPPAVRVRCPLRTRAGVPDGHPGSFSCLLGRMGTPPVVPMAPCAIPDRREPDLTAVMLCGERSLRQRQDLASSRRLLRGSDASTVKASAARGPFNAIELARACLASTLSPRSLGRLGVAAMLAIAIVPWAGAVLRLAPRSHRSRLAHRATRRVTASTMHTLTVRSGCRPPTIQSAMR